MFFGNTMSVAVAVVLEVCNGKCKLEQRAEVARNGEMSRETKTMAAKRKNHGSLFLWNLFFGIRVDTYIIHDTQTHARTHTHTPFPAALEAFPR